MDQPKGKVCVTGASGFLASWLIKRLLLAGYQVIGTVRDPGNEKKVEHLRRLEGAKERLQLVKADLLEDGSFDDAIMGCLSVFHTASPVIGPSSDPKAEILEPAIKGTLNVLGSCKRNPSLKRVVLTSSSSTARIRDNFDPNVPLDESSWSSVELCESLQSKRGTGKCDLECAIFLVEVADDDFLRILIVCYHCFHRECKLESHKTCSFLVRTSDLPLEELKEINNSTFQLANKNIYDHDINNEHAISITIDDDEETENGEDDKTRVWYALSKTLAEKAAWEFCNSNGIDLVTVLPSFVIGPSLPQDLCSTASDVLGLLQGKVEKFEWHGRMGYVHIDDVALCHILVSEHKDAHGRYLCSAAVLDNDELVSILSQRYPWLPVPKRFQQHERPSYEFNVSKLESLGFKFKSIQDMFEDCVASLVDQGYLPAPSAAAARTDVHGNGGPSPRRLTF